MAEQFKWVDFYMEFATELLMYKQDRAALIKKIKNVYSAIGMNLPKLETDNDLKDIDPFTVFGLFNKGITDDNRISIIKGISKEFGITAEIPEMFPGVPILNNMAATFYAFTGDSRRTEDDLDNLWALFEAAINLAEKDDLDRRSKFVDLFDKVKKQYAIRWNITMGLFWIRPYTFINLDSRNREYLSAVENTSIDIADKMRNMKSVPAADEYLSFIDQLKATIESGKYDYSSFPELSFRAFIADDRAWLLTFNKDKWNWDGFAEQCESTKEGKTYDDSWTCSSKSPQIGDEVFLIKLGEKPRGLIGHGTVLSEPYIRESYDSTKAATGKTERAIDVRFDYLINYESEKILSQEELMEKCSEQHWSPQSSGIKIKPEVLPVLRELWDETIRITEDDWWPSLSDYDPGITAQTYYDLLIDESIVKRTWLEALHDMYLLPGHLGTCWQMSNSNSKGLTPGHYNRYLTSAAAKIAKMTKCPLLPREETNSRYWPVLFQGRVPSKKGQGNYCWKMREPVIKAIEMLIDKGMLEKKENASMSQFDHNMILYGPPGTGKTYNSVIYAVAICDGRNVGELRKEPYSDVLLRYKELQAAGRIAFTTFHQSYGYEEFIEGIKPKLDEESGMLGYTIEDGVFKSFCKSAKPIHIQTKGNIKIKDHPRIWIMLLGGPGVTSLKEECFSNGEVRIGWNEVKDDIYQDDETISWRAKQMLHAFIYEMEPGDIVLVEKDAQSIDAIGVIAGDYEFDKSLVRYPRKRKVDWIAKNIDENMVQYLPGGRKQLARFTVYAADYITPDALSELLGKYTDSNEQEKTVKEEPYVFIIDEINRGNISKIFGELITLIEETKRAGAPEAMEAVLPYSGESFSVPRNVYILGTMNTADRSIALMDTALRRRFDFIEMMPDPEVLESLGAGKVVIEGEEFNIARMLEIINERIEFLFDREHTIGHAFFTKLAKDPSIKTLASIFEKNVIPLLQEYFYEDYAKIQFVLGDNEKADEYKFILDKPLRIKDIFNGNPDIDLPESRYVIQREAFYKLESYKQIGKGI